MLPEVLQQTSNLLIDILVAGDRAGHLGPKQFAIPLSQAIGRLLGCRRRDALWTRSSLFTGRSYR
jgi:hypothetical protein